MCLPVSRLFWVSSLVYPNLLGTKGYVVVVVVVVVYKFACLLKIKRLFCCTFTEISQKRLKMVHNWKFITLLKHVIILLCDCLLQPMMAFTCSSTQVVFFHAHLWVIHQHNT
jgi:hypothetical protein